MCGTKCLFPELLQFLLAPPFPPDAMLDDSSASLSLRTTLHGGRGEGRIWPKERWFPCEKLIDCRSSAFCKLVPHNFGQDCSSKRVKPWSNGTSNSSRFEPHFQPGWGWVSFGHARGSSWVEVDHQAQILAQLEPSFSQFGHLDKLSQVLVWLLGGCAGIVSNVLILFVRPGSLFLLCNLARVGFSCEYFGGCSDPFSREIRSARQVTIFSWYTIFIFRHWSGSSIIFFSFTRPQRHNFHPFRVPSLRCLKTQTCVRRFCSEYSSLVRDKILQHFLIHLNLCLEHGQDFGESPETPGYANTSWVTTHTHGSNSTPRV